MDEDIPDDEFERIVDIDRAIREILGAERKVILETGHSPTKRAQKIKEIIDRRAKGAVNNDT